MTISKTDILLSKVANYLKTSPALREEFFQKSMYATSYLSLISLARNYVPDELLKSL